MSNEISAAQVMKLRKKTGVGVSKCKEALTESNGDFEEAIQYLRKKGMATLVAPRATNSTVHAVTTARCARAPTVIPQVMQKVEMPLVR